MIAYTLGSAVIPVMASLYSATCRLSRPTRRMRHARTWSRPHPLRQRSRGSHVFHGRHEFRPTLTGVTA